ncbi:MAG: YncE family protein, partial [Candidatus Binataceae bacterium]
MQRVSIWLVAIGAGLTLSIVFSAGTAAAKKNKRAATFGLQKTIAIPGGLTSFDITFVDDPTQTVFVADQTNRAIDIIDGKRDTLLTQFIPQSPTAGGFAGVVNPSNFDLNGPDGVLEARYLHQLWVGDADSRVWVIDIKDRRSPKVLDVISTALPTNPADRTRADELAYDQADQIILIANPGDTPPYVTLISAKSHKILAQLTFPTATNGLEQSVFDPRSHLFYLAVPEANGPNTGEVVAIDPKTLSVVSTPVASTGDCEQSGMALFNARQRLLLGCSRPSGTLVLDLKTKTLTNVPQTGGSDEVWFDPHDKIYYLADVTFGFNGTAGTPALGVIDARNNAFIENIFDGSTNPFTTVLHSVAADGANGHVYVPLAANSLPFDNNPSKGLDCSLGCVGVFFGDL